MTLWNDLTTAALLGTGRGAAPIHLPGRLNELLTGIEAEDRLLRAAGILALADLAALTPIATAELLPSPAPPETDANSRDVSLVVSTNTA